AICLVLCLLSLDASAGPRPAMAGGRARRRRRTTEAIMSTNADDADAALSQARRSMTRLAINLQRVLTPIEVAGVLAGAATGVLTSTYGREKAVEYFTE